MASVTPSKLRYAKAYWEDLPKEIQEHSSSKCAVCRDEMKNTPRQPIYYHSIYKADNSIDDKIAHLVHKDCILDWIRQTDNYNCLFCDQSIELPVYPRLISFNKVKAVTPTILKTTMVAAVCTAMAHTVPTWSFFIDEPFFAFTRCSAVLFTAYILLQVLRSTDDQIVLFREFAKNFTMTLLPGIIIALSTREEASKAIPFEEGSTNWYISMYAYLCSIALMSWALSDSVINFAVKINNIAAEKLTEFLYEIEI